MDEHLQQIKFIKPYYGLQGSYFLDANEKQLSITTPEGRHVINELSFLAEHGIIKIIKP